MNDIVFFMGEIIRLIQNQREKIEIFKPLMEVLINFEKPIFLKMVHIYVITIYESFNKEFFLILQKNKNEFSKERIGEIPKANPYHLKKYLKKSIGLQINRNFRVWETFRENICRRHVIIHKKGIIDKKYTKCIGSNNSKLIGKRIGREINHDTGYVLNCVNNIREYIVFVFKTIIDYYFNLKEIDVILKNIITEHGLEVNPDILWVKFENFN